MEIDGIAFSGVRKSAVYKLLLVDDEQIVREGIADTIDWASLGFEFAGAYENGTDADTAIDRISPDVVITDICMPFGGGLELTEQVAKKHPEIMVILLSGFDEFEYAQRAIRLGAYDYILKPITADEMRTLLERVRAALDAKTQRTEELQVLSRSLERTRDTRLSGLTERIMRGVPADEDLFDKEVTRVLQDSGIELPRRSGAVLALLADAVNSENGSSDSLAPRDFAERASGSFLDHAHRTISIVEGESERDCLERAREAARYALAEQHGSGVTVTIGIGSPFVGPGGFAASYRDAVCSLEYRFIAGLGRRIEHSEVAPAACHLSGQSASSEVEWSPRFTSAVSDVVRALRACDPKEAASSAERLMSVMRSEFASRAQYDLQIHSCLVKVNELATELGRDPIPIEFFTSLSTVEQVERQLKEICASIIQAQVEHGETFGGIKTRGAIEYIQQNYASPSLSLTTLCDAIGVSSSYLSPLFKSHTGKTFVEYMTEVRVDHAKLLLKTTDLRIYEVAKRVGYRDHHYFCTIFKRVSGRSPMEFRRGAAVTHA